MMLMRTAKSCRSGAPMLASSLREEAQATVSNKRGHRGEREVSRKTIARGMPGDFRRDRGDYARMLFSFACEAAGASGARHSLRPLISRRRDVQVKTRAECAARSRSRVWRMICSTSPRFRGEVGDGANGSGAAPPDDKLREVFG